MQRSRKDISSLYAHLSLRDLLEAREQYHIHLMRHPNVVGTAIGLYRIRKGDSQPRAKKQKHSNAPRTMENSEVRDYSWPCILVFVREWVHEKDFKKGAAHHPDDFIPRALYVPDGRCVPVCVVLAPQDEAKPPPSQSRPPLNNLGGGWPVLAKVQGEEHIATVACLVSDGHHVYALTNRHVAGTPGEELFSMPGGKAERVGVTGVKQLTRARFTEVYPGWPGRDIYVNLDVGLIAVDQLSEWSSKVRGVRSVDSMVDLAPDNFSLDLIDRRVCGSGAVTGIMHGRINALFYRYKSLSGSEYVADFLIGPDPDKYGNGSARGRRARGSAGSAGFSTHPGDSGTLWLLLPREKPKDKDKNKNKNKPTASHTWGEEIITEPAKPIAMQWGAHALDGNGKTARLYPLATALSTVCGMLEVDLVRDWNTDTPNTWGAIGHFSIARCVVEALSADFPKLVRLMQANVDLISPDKAAIRREDFPGMGKADFVPLADVPDFYWKHASQGFARPPTGGFSNSGAKEGPNHFADMDQPNGNGDTLFDLCKDPANIDPDVWDNFYEGLRDLLSGNKIESRHRGLLPFRIWQIFDEMVGFARKGDAERFMCAAGVLTHYVGDACQPLHISYMHDGDPEQATTRTIEHVRGKKAGTSEEKTEPLGVGIHAAYEDLMIDAHRDEILTALSRLPKVRVSERIATGYDAARTAIALMRATYTQLPPRRICDEYISVLGWKRSERIDHLWKKFGTRTVEAMQTGTRFLAILWESAWEAGTGERQVGATPDISEDRAMQICGDQNFLRSYHIGEIGAHLRRPADAPRNASSGTPVAPRGRSRGATSRASAGSRSSARNTKKSARTRSGKKTTRKTARRR